MNRRTTILASAAMTMAFSSVALADPASCDTTYEGPNGGAWHEEDNWDFGKPTSSSVACVEDPDAVIVFVGECNLLSTNSGAGCMTDVDCEGGDPGVACIDGAAPDAVCKALNIARGTSTVGIVIVQTGASLTLHGPTKSTIDGLLMFGSFNPAVSPHALKLAGDITIEGTGGKIFGNPYEPYPTIESVGGTYKLTLCGAPGTDPACDVDAGISDSLTLENGWVVEVALQNDAYVLANYDELELDQAPVSGSGHWTADFVNVTAGELVVNVAVTGSGTWTVANTDDRPVLPKIIFNADCPDLTGDFILKKDGILEINADVVTTGHLAMESKNDTAPQIIVAAGASIEFNAAP